MNNLVIVGNGFDLAHGLKTNYEAFMKHVVDSQFKDEGFYEDLFVYKEKRYTFKNLVAIVLNGSANSLGIQWENGFFMYMVSNIAHEKWCDVEKLYFDLLINIKLPNEVKKLNDEFENVKKHLEEYLEMQKVTFKQIPCYSSFFSHLNNSESPFVLNFNYTDTVLKYCSNIRNLRIVNIHGELKSESNPIIFGFAADDRQSRDLIGKDDKEYMRNIKKQCYKRTTNQNKLVSYLNATKKIDVLIFGHSCGISDKLILNQIFNHKNINSIRIFYHEIHEAYFETQVNIDRIMNNDENFEKLMNFEESCRMPQFNDSGSQSSSFEKYISELLATQIVQKRMTNRVV